jgi:glycosyltransferase involved in cell wall biosynthesis
MSVLLSLAMIVKNEEKVLGRILSQAQTFCDELIVVDTGSTDKTVEIAHSFGATVYNFKWINDFSAARNFAFSKCTHNWVMWLDADDVVPESSQQAIRDLKEEGLTDDTAHIVFCTYQIAFSNNGACTLSMERERIIQKSAGGSWKHPIHEYYEYPANCTCLNRLDIVIEHRKLSEDVARDKNRNLDFLTILTTEGSTDPHVWYYYAKELWNESHHERAIEAIQRYLCLGAHGIYQHYQALYYGMNCLMKLGRNDEALDWGFQALKVDSSRAEVLVSMGIIYYRQKAFKKAIPLLTAATQAFRPNGGQTEEADYCWRPYHYLSLCYEGINAPEKAIAMALKALPSAPDKAVLRDNITCYTAKIV